MKFILRTRDGQLDKADRETFSNLKKQAAARPNILLHLHGGLVSEANGIAVADRLSAVAPTGFGLNPDWQQIYLVWRTGPLETIQSKLEELYKDRLYSALLRQLVHVLGRRFGVDLPNQGRGIGASQITYSDVVDRLATRPAGDPFFDIPVPILDAADRELEADIDQDLRVELDSDASFQEAAADIASAVAPGPATGRGGDFSHASEAGGTMLSKLDPSIIAELTPTEGATQGRFGQLEVGSILVGHACRIALSTLKRIRSGRDHGLYATIVEELCRDLYGAAVGSSIWGQMKAIAAHHFDEQGFGRELMKAIPDEARLIVTGHSAGSIWAAEMLKYLGSTRPDLKLDLILLAPAVRVDLIAGALRTGGQHVRRARIYTMSDALERKDAVLGHDKGYIYPSSLLYLVSGIFETTDGAASPDAPLLGLQRFIGENGVNVGAAQALTIDEVTAFYRARNDSICYSPSPESAASGLRTRADSHGAFDSEAATIASVATFFS